MKVVDKNIIKQLVREAIPHLAYEIPEDVYAGICEMCKDEKVKLGKDVLCQLQENYDIARQDQVPICQDTGTTRVTIVIGKNVLLAGDVFEGVNEAVAEAYESAKLRKSVVADALIDRSNTGDNTPAFCEVKVVDEPDVARLDLMIKGGGSDNASRVVMMVPGDGKQGIIDNIVKCVEEKAAAACPPLVLGIGIGSTFDHVAGLAQDALFRPLGVSNENPEVAAFEQEILEAVNSVGIGAGGLGGIATVEQVNVETAPTHIASMPLAIDMGCSALRRTSIDIPCREIVDKSSAGKEIVKTETDEKAKQYACKAVEQTLQKEREGAEQATKAVKAMMKKTETVYRQSHTLNKEDLSKSVNLNLPLSREDLKGLKAGDQCLLTGPIYILRDAGHIRLLEEMKEGEPLPYNLEGQTIFYAGPSPELHGRPFGSVGPTTATRMDFAAGILHENGVVATIGKGHRSDAIRESCKKTNSVFFVTVGGCAAYLAKCIKDAELIAYGDLGPEALRKCEVMDFPVYVGIDVNGNDVYEQV